MGFFSEVGGFLNDVTGASTSSHKAYVRQSKLNKENYIYQQRLNEQSYAEQEKLLKLQQAYDTQMANTAIKRQMEDYANSGINPAMAVAGQGAGGGGPMATSANAGGVSTSSTNGNMAGMSITDIANSAVSAYRNIKDVATQDEKTPAEINAMLSNANKQDAETAETLAKLPYISKQQEAQYNKTVAETANKRANTALQIENTKRTQEGWGANILGTKTQNAGYKAIGTALLGALPIGKAYNTGKALYKARNFGKFLKGL